MVRVALSRIMLRRLPLLGAGVLALWLVLHSSTLRASESVVVHEEVPKSKDGLQVV